MGYRRFVLTQGEVPITSDKVTELVKVEGRGRSKIHNVDIAGSADNNSLES